MNQETINYLSYGSEIHNIIKVELRTIYRQGAKFIEDKIDYHTKQYADKYNLTNITYCLAFPALYEFDIKCK